MLIGEAPGYREEIESKPFSGRAGQYLDQCLEQVGLKRNEVYITNVVHCRPPDNRTPTKKEIAACSPFLQKEIKHVRPKYILLLGGTALQALLGRTGVGKHSGTWVPLDGAQVLTTYHPSGVLRNLSLNSKFMMALRQFANRVKGGPSRIKTHYDIVRTSAEIRSALAELAHAPALAWDIETTGLDPLVPGSRLLTAAFAYAPGHAIVFPLEHPEVEYSDVRILYRALQKILGPDGPKKIAHNAKFEQKWALTRGMKPTCWFDTQVAAYLLDENSTSSLKPLAKAMCGAPDYDEGISFTGKNKGRIYPLETLASYNAADSDYTLRLFPLLRQALLEEPRLARLFKFLMMPAQLLLAEMELRGIAIDTKRLQQRTREAEDIREGILRTLNFMVKGQKPRRHMPEGLEVNWNSPKFLRWFFYERLGLPVLERTRTGLATTREGILLQLDHEAVRMLLRYREWQGYLSKFLWPWPALIREGRLHTTYNLTRRVDDRGKEVGTVTGRLSSPFHMTPRDPFIRGIVKARKGYKLIQADFSQVELRIAAWMAKEPTMSAVFKRDGDIHLETAMEVTGQTAEEIDKETRKKAKAINFGFLYGMYPKKFQKYAKEKYGQDLTLDECRTFRAWYFRRYSGLETWHAKQRRLVKADGCVWSAIGRCRHLPNIYATDGETRSEAERQAINSPVQSLASDCTVLSMVLLRQQLSPPFCYFVGQVHDSILFEVREDWVDQICAKIRDTMENLPLRRLFGVRHPPKLTVDIEVGTHWSEGRVWPAET